MSLISYHDGGYVMKHTPALVVLAIFLFAGFGCSPTVRMATPEKPITINLNVKIQHEILVKVDKELDSVLSEDSGLF
jgi:type IV pilus biogenesis protein CpaD/CtpE